jgi:hypothetical protein
VIVLYELNFLNKTIEKIEKNTYNGFIYMTSNYITDNKVILNNLVRYNICKNIPEIKSAGRYIEFPCLDNYDSKVNKYDGFGISYIEGLTKQLLRPQIIKNKSYIHQYIDGLNLNNNEIKNSFKSLYLSGNYTFYIIDKDFYAMYLADMSLNLNKYITYLYHNKLHDNIIQSISIPNKFFIINQDTNDILDYNNYEFFMYDDDGYLSTKRITKDEYINYFTNFTINDNFNIIDYDFYINYTNEFSPLFNYIYHKNTSKIVIVQKHINLYNSFKKNDNYLLHSTKDIQNEIYITEIYKNQNIYKYFIRINFDNLDYPPLEFVTTHTNVSYNKLYSDCLIFHNYITTYYNTFIKQFNSKKGHISFIDMNNLLINDPTKLFILFIYYFYNKYGINKTDNYEFLKLHLISLILPEKLLIPYFLSNYFYDINNWHENFSLNLK